MVSPAQSEEFRTHRQGSAALALRLAGASYSEIVEALGYSSTGLARQAVEAELGNRAAGDPAARELLRGEESARLLRLLRGVWGKASNPEHPEHLPAANIALRIVDRHIRLMGLDAPAEVVVHTPTLNEIDAWVATMTATSVEDLAIEEADVVGESDGPPALSA